MPIILGINLIDWLIICGYLLGITALGLFAIRRVHNSSSFFIGDRKFGKIMMIFFTFGAGTSSDHAIGVAAKAYQVGAPGIWYQWLWLFSTPFYWLIAPLFRRMRAVTTADYFVTRYSRSVGVLYTLVALLQLVVSIGVILKGSGAVITAISDGAVPPALSIWVIAVLFTVYGIAGGLNAAILTDLVQGILTIVLSFLILPFALHAVGGLTGLRATIADDAMFQMVSPSGSGITVFYVVVISINALIGIVTGPATMALGGAGKTEMVGRVGQTFGSLLKRVCTIAWVLTGMCAISIYMGQDIDIDQVFGLMARDLLPTIAPGLVGLFIASMLAAVMSSCDACMVCSAGLFTDHIYRPFIRRDQSERHYTFVGRMSSGVVVIIGIFFAFELENVVRGLEVFWMVQALMGIAFWMGLFWRRATVAGAWVSTLLSFVVFLFTDKITLFGNTLWDFNAALAHKLPGFMVTVQDGQAALQLPWQMIVYLTTGFVSCLLVSLFTQPVSKQQLDGFYECMRTPVRFKEKESKPFTLPEGVAPAERRVLLNNDNFEIPVPSVIAVTGFVGTWIIVGLLIAVFYWILQL